MAHPLGVMVFRAFKALMDEMIMKREIFDPSEIHLLLVSKFQKSSVNILVRAEIDICPTLAQIKAATAGLVRQHAYLNARYYSEEKSHQVRYFYEEVECKKYSVDVVEPVDSLQQVMASLSPMRRYVFSLHKGELIKVVVYQKAGASVVELTMAHIVGEGPSAFILMGDLLGHLDQQLGTDKNTVNKESKYFFKESDFGWPDFSSPDAAIRENPLPPLTDAPDNTGSDPWVLPDAVLQRYKLPSTIFVSLSQWLKENRINAKVSDVFYYIAYKLLKKMLNRSPEFWLIMSYRNQLQAHFSPKTIYNFAFFSPVMSELFDGRSIHSWLKDFFHYREQLISPENVALSRRFFYQLNKAMENEDLATGKRFMDSVVKVPDFSFNNFGKLDQYIGEQKHFTVSDIDLQDGTPAQEIRYFSYRDSLFFNPTFFKEGEIDLEEFWTLFTVELDGFSVKSDFGDRPVLA